MTWNLQEKVFSLLQIYIGLPNSFPVGIHNRLAGWLKKFWTLDFRLWTLGMLTGWVLDFGKWTLDFGKLTLDFVKNGLWTLQKWTLDFAKNVIERDN